MNLSRRLDRLEQRLGTGNGCPGCGDCRRPGEDFESLPGFYCPLCRRPTAWRCGEVAVVGGKVYVGIDPRAI